MKRRLTGDNREKKLFTKRFFPAGTYTWTVPAGCTEVDAFCVGGGGAGGDGTGGGGGYTSTKLKIPVTSGDAIQVVVGKGGVGRNGYTSKFGSYVSAKGGYQGGDNTDGGNGGSGGGAKRGPGGSDGSDGGTSADSAGSSPGTGQHRNTRDFGELSGKRNAGGGAGETPDVMYGGASDYTEGAGKKGPNRYDDGEAYGGGGYGGGGGAARGGSSDGGNGGDGTVLIRYWAYEE